MPIIRFRDCGNLPVHHIDISLPAIGLILLAYAVITPARALAESRLQHGITGVSRASVTSAVNVIIGGLYIVVPVVLGFIAKVWHLPAIYLFGAVQLLAVAGCSTTRSHSTCAPACRRLTKNL